MLTLNHVTPVLKTLQDPSSLIKNHIPHNCDNTMQDLASRSASDLTSSKGDVVHWSLEFTMAPSSPTGLCSHSILSEAFPNFHILKIVNHPLRFITSHLSFLLYALVPPNT